MKEWRFVEMTFSVTVKNREGKPINQSDLENYVIQREDYYQKTAMIDRRIETNNRNEEKTIW